MSKGYFPVTHLHRNDLETRGFCVSEVSNETMKAIAAKMENAYIGSDQFWLDLDYFAEEFGIPKIQCPVCHENVDSCLICLTCGVDFSNPCAVCEERGYHKEGCTTAMTK